MLERNTNFIIETLQKNIPKLMEENEVVGLAIALIEKGEIITKARNGENTKRNY